jgi:SAM-dependent methyltransferase
VFSDNRHNPLGRFDGLASIYARYRPNYPAQAIDFVVEKIQDRRFPIADVGAGTGILSRQLAERGFCVIGIEPNESMRTRAAASPSAAVDYRAGRAEATGLEPHSVAGVVAGQTFHWCAPDSSLREFHRILRPGAWVTLMWNIADTSDPFTAAYWRLLREGTPEPEIVENRHDMSGRALLVHPLFDAALERSVAHFQELDDDALLGRAFSSSFAPKECQAAERLAIRLRELFGRFAHDGRVRLLYQTTVYQARGKSYAAFDQECDNKLLH